MFDADFLKIRARVRNVHLNDLPLPVHQNHDLGKPVQNGSLVMGKGQCCDRMRPPGVAVLIGFDTVFFPVKVGDFARVIRETCAKDLTAPGLILSRALIADIVAVAHHCLEAFAILQANRVMPTPHKSDQPLRRADGISHFSPRSGAGYRPMPVRPLTSQQSFR